MNGRLWMSLISLFLMDASFDGSNEKYDDRSLADEAICHPVFVDW